MYYPDGDPVGKHRQTSYESVVLTEDTGVIRDLPKVASETSYDSVDLTKDTHTELFSSFVPRALSLHFRQISQFRYLELFAALPRTQYRTGISLSHSVNEIIDKLIINIA